MHFKHFIIYTSLLCSTLAVKAQPLQEFPIDKVELNPSWVKEREQLDIDFIRGIDADRLLHTFRLTAGIPSQAEPLGGWEAPYIGLRGHFTGHYLSALSTLVNRYGDDILNQRLKYLIDELERCQQANGKGYLSAFPETDFDVLETRFGGVWAPYYTLHKLMQGLLDAYTLAGHSKAYDMALRMADYINNRMSYLTNESLYRIFDTRAANPSNEAGGMNEVLYKLYSISHDPKHLRLAHLFDPDWFASPLSQGKDVLSGLHSNTHIVLVQGFFWRYKLTNEQKYWNATQNFWDILYKDHTYANGTSSGPHPQPTTPTSKTAEHWGDAGKLCNTLSSEIGESCVTHNTQKLSAYMFSQTGSPLYADKMMDMYWNAILPIQSASTGKVVYHLPLGSPRTKKYLQPGDFFCCSGSSTEAFTRLNANIYWHNDNHDALWINQYVPSTLQWEQRGVTIEQDGEFPQSSSTTFTVKTTQKQHFALNLLIPSWAEKASISINGKKTSVKVTGKARYHTISRKWKDSDKVQLHLQGGFKIHHLQGDCQTIAISYGPMLLAFIENDKIELQLTEHQLLNNLQATDASKGIFTLNHNGKQYTLRPLFDVDDETYSVYVQLKP